MSNLNSDSLDTACVEIKGHNNWAYVNELNEESRNKILADKNAMVVVFYRKPKRHCDDCGSSNEVEYDDTTNDNLCYGCRNPEECRDWGEVDNCNECEECGYMSCSCTC